MKNGKPEERYTPVALDNESLENVNGGSSVNGEFRKQPRSVSCPHCRRSIQIFTNEAMTLKCPYCNTVYNIERESTAL